MKVEEEKGAGIVRTIRGDNVIALASKHFKMKCFSFQRLTEERNLLDHPITNAVTSQRRVIKLTFKLLKHWGTGAAFHKIIVLHLIV